MTKIDEKTALLDEIKQKKGGCYLIRTASSIQGWIFEKYVNLK